VADTQRTVSEILTLLADNTSAAISAQDVRDAFVSWRSGWGQIYVAAADTAAITISNTSSYFEATTPAWTLSSGGLWFDESDGNGRLTYTGTPDVTVFVTATVSMTSGSSSQVTHWRIAKNGTADAASETQRKIGTGADVGAAVCSLVTTLANGDHLSLAVRNSTGANNVTLEVATLNVVTLPA
jgi:hypothetical protein